MASLEFADPVEKAFIKNKPKGVGWAALCAELNGLRKFDEADLANATNAFIYRTKKAMQQILFSGKDVYFPEYTVRMEITYKTAKPLSVKQQFGYELYTQIKDKK